MPLAQSVLGPHCGSQPCTSEGLGLQCTPFLQRAAIGLDGHAIIIPTYNERENISLLVRGILDLKLDSRVIIVDDNSPDGTGELADQLAAHYPGVHVLHRPGKMGLGTAHVAGMKAALANGAAYILT